MGKGKDYLYWIQKYHSNFLNEILSPDDMKLGHLFNPDILNNLKERFLKDNYSILTKRGLLFKYSNQHFIYNIFCLEHYLQKLFVM